MKCGGPLRAAALEVAVLLGLGSCGDPMLPSDFSGPPASAVSGTVQRTTSDRDAAHPRLSLEWLTVDQGLDAPAPLLGQPVVYTRSSTLESDWQIGLGLPADAAKLDSYVGSRPVRFGVAKVVYFDDGEDDGRLNWGCEGPACDRVRALSDEYVLFIESPPICETADGLPRPRLAAGYHYYSFDRTTGTLRDLGPGASLTFTLIDRPPSEVNPSDALRAFSQALLRAWSIAAIQGC